MMNGEFMRALGVRDARAMARAFFDDDEIRLTEFLQDRHEASEDDEDDEIFPITEFDDFLDEASRIEAQRKYLDVAEANGLLPAFVEELDPIVTREIGCVLVTRARRLEHIVDGLNLVGQTLAFYEGYEDALDVSDFFTFDDAPRPEGIEGVYSWDATRVLVDGTLHGETEQWHIIPRPEARHVRPAAA